MKKFICAALTGAMVLSVCACSKKETKKTTNEESETTKAVSDGTPEFGTDEYYESIQYYVDPTSEAELTKILDTVYAGEPKLGDNQDDIYNKVIGTIGKEPISSSLYSEGNTYNFEFGWDTNHEYLQGKDRLIYLGYWNYETGDGGELFGDETVVAYEQSYVNPTRPGAGCFLLWVYDEDRANAAYDIISKYLTDYYAEYNPEIEEGSLMGYQLKCGEGGFEYYAYVRILHDEETDVWQVYTEVFFADPELIEVSGFATEETTESSETSESDEIIETDETTIETSETENEAEE